MIFKTTKNNEFIIKEQRNFIIFETTIENLEYTFTFEFEEDIFKSLIKHIKDICNKKWSNFKPKEATCLNNDYFEYYDRKFDSNGYLKLLENGFKIERPSLDSKKLYQLNKGRIESLIYDIENK